jgi:MFS transporter, NNP family, nitrate/nitrite transporter
LRVTSVRRPEPTTRASHEPPRARRTVVLLAAVLAFAANSAAWSLIRPAGPHPWHHVDLGSYEAILLLTAPVLVGSLGRIPVGMLADRYGPQLILPALTVAAAGAVLAAALAESLPAAVLAGCALGVAGTAFPVGAALVTSTFPQERRGFVLSVYGAGTGGIAVTNLAWLRLDDGDDRVLLVLAAVLLGCAVLVAAATRGRDREARRRPEPARRVVGHFLRLPAIRHLAAWYAAAFGGVMALGLYLPPYLRVAYHLGWHDALLAGAAAVALAAAARPVGGWLAGRVDPTNLLALSYGTVAVFAVMVALRLSLPVTLPAGAGLAACLGLACGVVLALIGNTAPADRSGTIVGIVGAAGGLAGMLPSLLLGISYERTASASVGWALLSGVAATFAMYLRGQRGWMGAALAFAAPPTGPVTTVVSLAAADARRNSAGVVATLGALAGAGDLVIVYGYRDQPSTEMTPHALVAGLRARHPRHVIVTAYIGAYAWPNERGLITDVLDEGGIVVICTPTTDIDTIAMRLAERRHAAQLLQLTDDSIDGFRLRLPWPADDRVAAR